MGRSHPPVRARDAERVHLSAMAIARHLQGSHWKALSALSEAPGRDLIDLRQLHLQAAGLRTVLGAAVWRIPDELALALGRDNLRALRSIGVGKTVRSMAATALEQAGFITATLPRAIAPLGQECLRRINGRCACG